MENTSKAVTRLISAWKNDSGVAALEFAIVGPMTIVLVLGALSYGGYFWMAHSVQQLANDSARAALSGLDVDEREALARESLAGQMAGLGFLDARRADVTVEETETDLDVRVSYDASDTPFFSLSGLIPMPSPTIERSAMARLGGY